MNGTLWAWVVKKGWNMYMKSLIGNRAEFENDA